LRIPFSENKNDYKSLKIYPSPFYIPSDRPLIISGVIQGSSILITTITGEVIRSKKHEDMGLHGNQITWNGRDSSGNLVGSGVYLLSIYSQDGLNAVEKITVIRY